MPVKPLIPENLTLDYTEEFIRLLVEGKIPIAYPRKLDEWIALRESNKAVIMRNSGWDTTDAKSYRIAPLADRISTAFADFLWGDDPTIEPNDDADADLLAELLDENDISDELHYAEEIKSSEGQVWWRIYRDDEQMDVPILEWHSRTEVIPYFRGRRLLAVAFVDTIEDEHYGEGDAHYRECWRRLEIYGPGVTRNALFKSDAHDKIGSLVPLASREETVDFEEVWIHGLPMLAGCLINKRGKGNRKRWEGRSDYEGVCDLLYDLNEAHSIDRANYRLAGKKRAVMPEKYRDADGTARDADVYFAESEDEMETDNTFKLLEYQYDGAQAISRKQDLTTTVLTLVGLARQLVDPNAGDGQAASGTALKVRLIPMTATARGKGRPWDEGLPGIICLQQQVDALDEGRGGFGRPWSAAAEPPSVERGSILPEDPREELDYHVEAVNADLESMETAITALHPDWEEQQIKDEVKKILDENAAAAGFPVTDPSTVDGGGDNTGFDTSSDSEVTADETLTPEEFAAQFGEG